MQFSDVFRRDRGGLIITCSGARSQHVSTFPAVCFASVAGSGLQNRAGHCWKIRFCLTKSIMKFGGGDIVAFIRGNFASRGFCADAFTEINSSMATGVMFEADARAWVTCFAAKNVLQDLVGLGLCNAVCLGPKRVMMTQTSSGWEGNTEAHTRKNTQAHRHAYCVTLIADFGSSQWMMELQEELHQLPACVDLGSAACQSRCQSVAWELVVMEASLGMNSNSKHFLEVIKSKSVLHKSNFITSFEFQFGKWATLLVICRENNIQCFSWTRPKSTVVRPTAVSLVSDCSKDSEQSTVAEESCAQWIDYYIHSISMR